MHKHMLESKMSEQIILKTLNHKNYCVEIVNIVDNK
jgi:hypothetical protein